MNFALSPIPHEGDSEHALAWKLLDSINSFGAHEGQLPCINPIFGFFGIEHRDCLYVGDSDLDLEMCQAGGVSMIAYKNKALNADTHIEGLREIKDLLGSLPV